MHRDWAILPRCCTGCHFQCCLWARCIRVTFKFINLRIIVHKSYTSVCSMAGCVAVLALTTQHSTLASTLVARRCDVCVCGWHCIFSAVFSARFLFECIHVLCNSLFLPHHHRGFARLPLTSIILSRHTRELDCSFPLCGWIFIYCRQLTHPFSIVRLRLICERKMRLWIRFRIEDVLSASTQFAPIDGFRAFQLNRNWQCTIRPRAAIECVVDATTAHKSILNYIRCMRNQLKYCAHVKH